ncbi:MAG: energy-coupling factor ABC transporter ATP-binding protein [Candidatus Thorarchaeota archaeon]
MPLITIQNLFFSYIPDFQILNDLSLDLHEGEIVALIGKNGAGKTTLAKLLIGMLKPQSGEIIIDNKTIKKKSIADIAQKIGFVFQNPNSMLFTRSVEEELKLSLQRYNYTKDQQLEKINTILEFLNMKKYQQTHPRLLSRGEKQKLSLATVLIQDPKVIILDEPFSGIDNIQKNTISNYLLQLKEQGKLVVIISHDFESLIEYTDRIVALHNGSIFFNGTPKEFFKEKTQTEKIGLTNSPYLSLLFELRNRGLPETILKKGELIDYFCGK